MTYEPGTYNQIKSELDETFLFVLCYGTKDFGCIIHVSTLRDPVFMQAEHSFSNKGSYTLTFEH